MQISIDVHLCGDMHVSQRRFVHVYRRARRFFGRALLQLSEPVR